MSRQKEKLFPDKADDHPWNDLSLFQLLGNWVLVGFVLGAIILVLTIIASL